MTITVAKLVTGEIIIGNANRNANGEVRFKNPYQLLADGELFPYMNTHINSTNEDFEIPIHRTHILFQHSDNTIDPVLTEIYWQRLEKDQSLFKEKGEKLNSRLR